MVQKYDFNDSTQLSPHFNVQEFRCKCGKEHDILISDELIANLEKLYAALNCSKIIVTSGYRCTAHDKNVGGSGTGQHTLGKAADICCYGQDGQPISSKIVCQKAQDIGFTGIANVTAAYIYTHVDVRSGSKWYGDEVHGNSTVTDDFYKYFSVSNDGDSHKEGAAMKNLLLEILSACTFSFSGRLRRRTFWCWVLLASAVCFLLFRLLLLAEKSAFEKYVGVLMAMVVITTLYQGFSMAWRRLHDTGRSGAWALLLFVPVACFVPLVFFCMDSMPVSNQYGPSPKDTPIDKLLQDSEELLRRYQEKASPRDRE